MKKIKTSKSILKRFRVTSNGKFLRHQSSCSHLLQKKTSKRKQKLRKTVSVSIKDLCNFVNRLPYTS
uniref:ribosomal protein L35 n=1 Tax=Catenella fusiformis TaxID=3024791 RepID=UPI0027D9FD8D|nr:ribosomal protein L35 [Catenella fusiformis]WCH57541.1 ribosomal protein L35 [Catenella fusiformis]